jgi:hypothetical protein
VLPTCLAVGEQQGSSGKDIILIFAAAIVATLALGAITLWFFLGRRRRPQH